MGKKNRTTRGVTLKWVPTKCEHGLGAVAFRGHAICGCAKVHRFKARNSTVLLPLSTIDPARVSEPGYLAGLALEQRHTERRASTAAAMADSAEHDRKKKEQERKKRTNPVVIANTIKVPRGEKSPKAPSAASLRKPRRNYKAEYTAYIASPEWKAKRQEYIATVQPTECPICGGPWGKGDHIHHKSYKHMGAEPLDDLVHLCENCHDKVHRLYRKPRWYKAGLRATTDHLLARGRPVVTAIPSSL